MEIVGFGFGLFGADHYIKAERSWFFAFQVSAGEVAGSKLDISLD